jgi:hypothetical protein
MTSSWMMEATYDVDYWGLAVLSVISDKTRMEALAQPFSTRQKDIPIVVFIPADFPSFARALSTRIMFVQI